MIEVTITTQDGKVYTDPIKIQVPINERTELFYHLLETFVPPEEKSNTTDDKTA